MTRSAESRAARILLSLYGIEAAALLILVALYKAPAYDCALLATKAGAALLAGAVALLASVWLLLREIRASGGARRRALALGVATNLLTGLTAFTLAELLVRGLARRDGARLVVGALALRPSWPELVEQSRKVLAGAAPWGSFDASYFVYDRELGWTVGPNRRSPDGLYFSSVEGIRSAGPNVRMADRNARFHVALIGDSNAFSFEVPFEDSWGHHLQRLLGDDVQVLNFGVDGYGIDQMLLRYRRDVRPWKPQVVVVGFIGHDLPRAAAVYPFVSFGWPGYLVKPRFTLEQGELALLNQPLPTPDEILGARRIEALPFVEYDAGYQNGDWRWRFDRGPLLLRFLTSAFPRWTHVDPRVSDETIGALNQRLLRELVTSAQQDDAVPLLVFLSQEKAPAVRETLAYAGAPVQDGMECLAEVPAERRFVPSGHHYTGLGNQAIARCTAPRIARSLEKTD